MKPNVSKPSRMSAAEAEALARRDKRRILIMLAALIMLAMSYGWARYQQAQRADDDLLARPEADEPIEQTRLYVPPFQDRSAVEKINDGKRLSRLTPDTEALPPVLRYTSALTSQHYIELDSQPLDAATASTLQQAPADHRLEPYWVRGEVIDLHSRSLKEASEGVAWQGTLRSDQDVELHFVVDRNPAKDNLTKGSFVRAEGLFLQLYSTEVGAQWIDAPMLVSGKLLPSYPLLALNEALDTPALLNIIDDDVDNQQGVPFDAQWELMAKALQDEGQVDWENAPTLDGEMLNKIFEDGETYRGHPFVIPISKNMDTRTYAAKENPLHLGSISSGWIGNYTWSGKAGLVKWVAPFVNPDLHHWEDSAKLVKGRGFFLKNLLYQSRDGNPGRAPFFVLQDLEVHTSVPDRTPMYILWGMFGITGFLSVLIVFLLRRERKSAQRLQQQLVQRRKARRDKNNPVPQGS